MVIVVVVDCFVDKSNGTAVSANNLVKTLRQKGHIVRVVAPYVEGNGAYRVDERYIPFVTEISHKQHMHFGKADKKVLREAFDGADIIHFFLPFKLEIIGVKIAKEMKVPYICGFHLQPENITYNAHLTWIPLIHQFIFWLFKYRIYRHTKYIHCPSQLIADELKRHNYNSKLYVISNGFTPKLRKLEKIKKDDYFHIAMTGRYTQEKRQDLLIEAVYLSKYEKQIKLHIKGLGPREAEYKNLASKLTYGADLGFVSDEELENLYSYVDLYVHTSDVDIESIATLEAISNGIVPIISDFYEEKELNTILLLLSINIFFSIVAIVPNAMLLKEKRFKFIAVRTFVIQFVLGVISVVAAYNGLGIYSLVINPIGSSLLLFVTSYKAYPVKWNRIQRQSIKKKSAQISRQTQKSSLWAL